MKSLDSTDAIDTIIRPVYGRDSVLTTSRAGDNPTQLFQLLNALDQPDLPGWPLLIPQKIQMQKCEKCSREFCAPINYRRHVRIHRRSLNVDKDSHKIRDMLAAFWDKLSLEKAKEVVSFNDVTLKEVSGSTVIKAWQASIRKPGVWTLPQDYMRSGSTLLDVIHAKPSTLPISSQELFYILDDASEMTFLCAGTAESVQKYVFDGDVLKIAHELRNIVACISFLFERKLVNAWLADKNVEALKCQKLLVEEEEAARKRRVALSKRKKQRKLRQKEQREKEQSLIQKPVLDVIVNSLEQSSMVYTSSQSTPGFSSDAPDTSPADVISLDEPVPSSKNEEHIDNNHGGAQIVDSSSVPNVESPVEESSNLRRRWRVPKSQRIRRNGFHEGQQQNPQLVQHVEPPSSQKVWTKKSRIEHDEVQPDENKCELIIGSISVSLPVKSYNIRKKDVGLRNKQKKSDDIKQMHNSENVQATGSRRQWRLLNSGFEARPQSPIIQSVNRNSANEKVVEKLDDAARNGFDGSCQQSDSKNDSLKERKAREFLSSISDVTVLKTGVVDFSSVSARAFLAERWKNAVSADHVKLVLPAVLESSGGGGGGTCVNE